MNKQSRKERKGKKEKPKKPKNTTKKKQNRKLNITGTKKRSVTEMTACSAILKRFARDIMKINVNLEDNVRTNTQKTVRTGHEAHANTEKNAHDNTKIM